MPTLLSPDGVPILGTSDRRIILPRMEDWEEVDASIARKRLPDAPWSASMTERTRRWQNGETIELAPSGRIRLGVAAALMLKNGDQLAPVFSQFDDTHPTRPLQLTPPGGILESRNVVRNILGELGQEMIITLPGETTQVGFWHDDKEGILEPDWVKAYAEAHGFELNHDLVIPVSRNIGEQFSDTLTEFCFGLPPDWDQIIRGWAAFECDTGSVEIMVPMIATLPKGVVLQDGEILPNGRYRGSKVIPMFLTQKAEVIMRAVLDTKA